MLFLLSVVASLGLSAWATPVQPRQAGGWCTFHVRQYQKNEGPSQTGDTSVYRFDIQQYDGAGAPIGDQQSLVPIADGQSAAILPNHPYNLIVIAGYQDQDAIGFEYAGTYWNSDSGQCNLGGYDGGVRNGDCGYTC